jgi:5-exo-hydroxycamphor dehydrogenase
VTHVAESSVRPGRRIAFRAPGQPLEIWDVEVPEPEPGGVLLRVVMAGVCGSDSHRVSGDMSSPPHPLCFGHESIGRIEALGAGVSTDRAGEPVAAGDLVYFAPASEATVPATGKIIPGAFDGPWPARADQLSAAGYQDWAWLPKDNMFYKIPAGTSPDAVIAFGCAMPTAIGAMTRLRGVRPGQTVVVQGCGPVGLSSALLASLAEAGQVIVIGGAAASRSSAASVRPGWRTSRPPSSWPGITASDSASPTSSPTGSRSP